MRSDLRSSAFIRGSITSSSDRHDHLAPVELPFLHVAVDRVRVNVQRLQLRQTDPSRLASRIVYLNRYQLTHDDFCVPYLPFIEPPLSVGFLYSGTS